MNIVCFDCETTGFDDKFDEVLQLSIIDGDSNVLFHSYVKPYFHKTWEAAEAVHGISPADVSNAPYPHEIYEQVKEIFKSADLLVGYNLMFDIRFLNCWFAGFHLESISLYDVMLRFAPIYGEWNEKYGQYKWQKLSTCANYFGYEFKAHDSLEDAKATLFCFKKIIEKTGDSICE